MLKPFVHEFQPFIEDMLEKEKVLRECADISIMNTIMGWCPILWATIDIPKYAESYNYNLEIG